MNATFLAKHPVFQPPTGTTDCRIHIVGSPDRYPFAAGRTYAMIPPPRHRSQTARTGLLLLLLLTSTPKDSRCDLP